MEQRKRPREAAPAAGPPPPTKQPPKTRRPGQGHPSLEGSAKLQGWDSIGGAAALVRLAETPDAHMRAERSLAAWRLLTAGRVAAALELYQQNLSECRNTLPDNDPQTLHAYREIATFLANLVAEGDTLVHPNNRDQTPFKLLSACIASQETSEITDVIDKEYELPRYFLVEQKDQRGRLAQVLSDALTPPNPTPPPEIVRLGEVLNDLHECQPDDKDKQAFADGVGRLLEKHGYCIRVLPEGKIARKMYVNGGGSLGYQCMDSSNPGLSRRVGGKTEPRRIELVPYQRHTKHRPSSTPAP